MFAGVSHELRAPSTDRRPSGRPCAEASEGAWSSGGSAVDATEAAGSRLPGEGAGPLDSTRRPRALTDAPACVSLKKGACSASAPVRPQLVGLNHARSLRARAAC